MSELSENFSIGLARRTLMQHHVADRALDPQAQETAAAQSMGGSVVELAGSFDSSREGATQHLLMQQGMAASDVRAMYPGHPQMQIAAQQMQIKADTYTPPGAADGDHDEVAPSRSREGREH